MDNDDLMLNIVTKPASSRGKTERESSGEKKISKTDVKRLKYSAKMKYNTNKFSKGKGKEQGLFRNIGTETKIQAREGNQNEGNRPREKRNRKQETNQQVKRQNETKIQYQQGNKRQNRRESSSSGFRQDRSYREQNFKQRRNNRSQQRPKSQFKPELRKDVTVTELMPDAEIETNNIAKNDLDNFKLQPKLKDSLIKAGVTKLTQIQVKTYESLVSGVDSVIKASTGSGKTLSYLIPLINRIIKNKTVTKREDGACVIVICPTRELCVQGQKEADRCLKRCPFIISGCLYGGEETNHEKSRLRKGINILFCTPGRVLYHLQQTKSFKLQNVQALVFQEADRTLDMGFQESIHKVLKILADKIALSHTHKILVSAHFNSKVSSLLEQLQMTQPHFIGFENMDSKMKLQDLKESKDVEINASAQLKQQYVLMSEEEKIPLMLAYLGVLKNCKALIFVSTIDEVEYFDFLLNNLKFRDSNGNDTDIKFQKRPIYKIHGDLDQKLRSKTYLQFRSSKQAILISTQIASRGLDFPDLSHILLFDVPPTITDYGNRVGRSARFNQTGVSLLMLHYLESDYAEKIRYYAPGLQVVDKEVIYGGFEGVLRSMNIGDSGLHYVEGLVRAAVKADGEKYMVARKAYVSMLRAYSRLPNRQIFAVKKLNLKLLARSFGLNSAQAGNNYNPQAKSSHLEASRKKRRVEDVKRLQFSQYM